MALFEGDCLHKWLRNVVHICDKLNDELWSWLKKISFCYFVIINIKLHCNLKQKHLSWIFMEFLWLTQLSIKKLVTRVENVPCNRLAFDFLKPDSHHVNLTVVLNDRFDHAGLSLILCFIWTFCCRVSIVGDLDVHIGCLTLATRAESGLREQSWGKWRWSSLRFSNWSNCASKNLFYHKLPLE